MEPKQRKQQIRATKRFGWIMYGMCAFGIYILGAALHSMIFDRDYFLEVGKQLTKSNMKDIARRGDILDCNGRTMVVSVPEYHLYLDLVVHDKDEKARKKTQAYRDTTLKYAKDSICEGLARIFPDKTSQYFKDRIDSCIDKKKNTCRLYPGNASYIQYKQCQQLPLLKESVFKGGFHGEPIMMRKKPYGSLASRTMGDVKNVGDTMAVAKNGIEQCYDSILRGIDGMKHRSKVRTERVDFSDIPPVEGHDLMSTIDVKVQDIAEKAIIAQMQKMKENGAYPELGMVIVMECATGDVKAIANMSLMKDGNYYERRNNAIGDRLEPGSTFKAASIMAALEDGKITKHTLVNTGNGTRKMYGKNMNDAGHVGYGTIDVMKVMQKSSNVGVSTLIDNAYHNDPSKYVESIKREGMGIPLHIPLKGAVDPLIKNPKGKFWYKTSLPWMSIGYETLLPPISTVTFYNGIANGGRVVQPRFVKAEMMDGKVIREFPVVTLVDHMCSDKTLADMHEILKSVVNADGATGRFARCPQFSVSGKTGTAQIAGNKKEGGNGYRNGWHLVSFCGYFPSDAPQYTCLVCMKVSGPAGGGPSCGPVFAQVAQSIMANGCYRSPMLAGKTSTLQNPFVWNGNMTETVSVLDQLGIHFNSTWATSNGILWGQSNSDQMDTNNITLSATENAKNTVPDVTGMGARDAVFTLQQCGLRVRIHGAGHVESQDIEPGSTIQKGKTITLAMK